MHSLDERVTRVHRKARDISERRRRVFDALLASVTCSLWGCLIFLATGLGAARLGLAEEPFGASLFGDGAGSYVLVALISFVSAVALTVLGLRHRARKDSTSHHDMTPPDSIDKR